MKDLKMKSLKNSILKGGKIWRRKLTRDWTKLINLMVYNPNKRRSKRMTKNKNISIGDFTKIVLLLEDFLQVKLF